MFCFTPRGRLIALPRGATPIDFAYALHTDIGDTTVGAKINGAIVPLVTPPAVGRRGRDHPRPEPSAASQLGDHRRDRQGALGHPPRRPRARPAARAYALGERMLFSLLERENVSIDDAEAEQLAKSLGYASKRELLVAVGEGKIESEPLALALANIKGIKKPPQESCSTCRCPTRPKAGSRCATADMFRFRVPGGQGTGPERAAGAGAARFFDARGDFARGRRARRPADRHHAAGLHRS